MRITGTEKTKKAEGMLRVFLDETYAFSLPEDEYVRLHMYEREEMSEEDLDRIRTSIVARAARETAVRMLVAKDRSGAELATRLVDKGYDRDIVDMAIAELETIGYVNDRRYIQKYVSEKLSAKSLSRKAIRYELEAKGIDTLLIGEVLDECDVDEEEVAMRAVRKKFGKYDATSPDVAKKLTAFLLHRGYTHAIVRSVLSRMKQEQTES